MWGEYSPAPAGTYNLVTDASTLTAGDIIIIAGTNEGTTKAISTNQNNNNRASVEVTLSSNSITLAADNTVQGITLEAGTTTGTFSFNTGDGYLYAASSSSNYLRTEAVKSANSSWNITISNGSATINAQGSNTHSLMRYNHSNNPPIFACYATSSTTGVLVNIYKKAPSGFTVDFDVNTAGYGTVSPSAQLTGVASGTAITIGIGANANKVTVNGTTVTATPHAQDANYNYAFSSWSVTDNLTTVTKNITITANFTRTERVFGNYRTLCACSAPTSPSISGTDAYTVGDNISLTASATGTNGSTTYTWYKGADWATASASPSIGSAATFTKNSCVSGDAGTYWCNISNGSGCDVQVSKTITVSAAAVPVTGVTLDENAISIAEHGGTQTLTATVAPNDASNKSVTWTTSDAEVATVVNGVVTGVVAGSATITVTTADGGYTATCTVTVTPVRYTVTLMDDNDTRTQSTYGGSVTLPSREACEGYTFAGWSTTYNATWTSTAPTIIPAGSYTPTANTNLYPVFTATSGGNPTAYSAGDEGDFVLASKVGDYWYALPTNPTVNSGKITGVALTVSTTVGGVDYVTSANASGKTWTIADATYGQTISDGSHNIYQSNGGSSGTNLTYGDATDKTWDITYSDPWLTFKGMSSAESDNSRGMLFNGTAFGGYSLGNADESSYYHIRVLPIATPPTTNYISISPCCGDPSSLTNGANNAASQNVSWSAPSSAPAGGYLVAYSTSTSTDPDDELTASDATYTIMNVGAGTLTANIPCDAAGTYNWWVRSKCSAGDFSNCSDWVKGTAFTMKQIYLQVNANWAGNNAKFVAYYWIGNPATKSGFTKIMTEVTDCEENIYTCVFPTEYSDMKFSRLDPVQVDPVVNFDNQWNGTGNLSLAADKNYYQITGGTGDGVTGSWSTYAQKVTVSFDKNTTAHGVTNPDAKCVVISSGKATEPTIGDMSHGRLGYELNGWWTAADGGTQIDFSEQTYAADQILHAHWTAGSPTTVYLKPTWSDQDWRTGNAIVYAHFYIDGTNQFEDVLMVGNSCDDVLRADAPSGATHVSFARCAQNTSLPLGDWESNSNVLNYVSGLAMAADYYYSITGWGSYGQKVGTAQKEGGEYTPTTYTISYAMGSTSHTGGNTIIGSKDNESKACNIAFTLPSSVVFTTTGYTQTGWATSDGGTKAYNLGGSYTTDAAQTFYPYWEVNTHTLAWALDGGAISSAGTAAGTVAYGTALTAPTVTKTGYTFNVWSPAVPANMPDDNVTYTATWTANTYYVRFNRNGGTGGADMANESFTYDVAKGLTTCTFSHPTKSFVGWATSQSLADAGTVAYTDGQSVSNLSSAAGATVDLYAVWVDCDLYTVTLKVHSDTYQVLQQTSCGAAVDLTGITPLATCLGDYTFVGWRTTDPGTTTAPSITTSYTPASNATLYAVYSKTEYVDWERIEDDDDLSEYDTYIITSYDNDRAMKAEQAQNNRQHVEITKSADKKTIASVPNTVGQFRLIADGSNWNIYDKLTAGTEKYLYAAGGSSNNYLRSTSDKTNGNAEWSISISSGAATVKAQGDATRNWMLDNAVFACYASKSSSYKLLSFYKYIHEAHTTYTTQPEISVRVVTKGTEDPELGTYTIVPGVVCEGGSVSLTATPTGSNSFVNWASDNGGTFANASSATTTFTPANASTTVTANFGMLITLDKNNASASTNGSASVTANATSLGSIVAPTYTGYHVEGYYDDDVYTHKVATDAGVLQENVAGYTGAGGAWTKGSGATLYTKWEANTHDLTWNLDGGATSSTTHTGYASSTVAYGTSITYPANNTMSRTGYTFNGWSPAAPQTMPDEDMTITALWTQNNWTLTMATDPVGVSSAITAPRTGAGTVENKHYGDVITVTVSTPSHYTFTGWTRSDGGGFTNASLTTTTFTMPDANVTVTANFEAETPHTVTWSDNGSTSTTDVFNGETTLFPAIEGCDMYVVAGWVLDDGTFTSETLTKPGTIYAAGATTPAVTGNVTYKAVYRHKYYTNDEFENGTTDGEGYYLYAFYNSEKNYKTTFYDAVNGFNTSTNKSNAVPILLEKVGDSYYMRDVSTDVYYYGSSGSLEDNGSREATNAYKWTFSTPSCSPDTKGDYKIVNEGDKASKTLLFNSGSGHYIKEYSNVNDCNASYYNFYLEPGYYYKYSPTKACYEITVSSNDFSLADFYTIDGSKKLDGTILTVKVNCGKTISSWSFTSGTASLASGDAPEYLGMEGDKEVYRFTIIPETDATIRINFGNGPTRTISFLDGATVLGQTKTAAITDKRDCGSYSLPAGYNTASGDGGACTGWTFDGWTATPYVFGQESTPSDIVAAGTSQDVHGDKTWYAVYHKAFAAGDYFKLLYGDKYVLSYGSNQFNTTTTEADGLRFQLEDGYLYYLDPTTHEKKWVYYQGSDGNHVTVSDNKPTSNFYKTTFTENGGTYEIVCNGKYLEITDGGKVYYYASTSASRRGTKPNASAFTAYYPKTECAIEYVTVTYDAGAGNSCSPASVSVESGSTFSLPIESDITYDNSDWTFVGWSESVVTGVIPGAPLDLIPGGGSYSTFADVTLHAVYNQVPPDGSFDNLSGGKYIIWAEIGELSYYAQSSGQVDGKLSSTLACSQAAIFEFVETETAGQYKIHISGEAKYLKGEACGHSDTDIDFVAAELAPAWTITTGINGDWRVTSTCGDRAIICENNGGSKQFGHYASSNVSNNPAGWYDVYIGQCDKYYTTNPNKALSVTGDVLVTSTNGRMVMAKDQLIINAGNIGSGAPVTITSNSSDVYFSTTRAVNISKAEKPTTSVTINADGDGNITAQTVYVHYMPSVATNGIEEVLVTVTSPEKTVEHTIKVRHLPATFAIAAKVGKNWYALTGNMNGAKTPVAIQIEVDESSWTAYAPDTCAYQLWPVKTTAASGDRYQTQGEKVRFSAVNNATTANAGLWANNSAASNTINNSAAITAISSDPVAQYEWKIAATEVSGTWKYALQMDQGVGANNNKLNIHRDAHFVWGTYTDGQAATSDIYLLPISEITPFEFQVVEWYPTKVLIETEAALASPTVKIAGDAVASPELTSKGGKLWEISGLTTLATNPTELLKINYTKDAVTYSALKSIPVIISRSTQNVTAEPFTTLTKDVYNYADLVVRDGAVLTLNGTEAENKFYDVTIYPTSKISVPEGKKLGVHSLTFFGGIDDIYDGSAYSVNKYGVPELSLKGQFGTKTVTTIDYVMRVDTRQMYSLTVPYDVDLNDITYWDGTSMGALGSKLWVSAYDGDARAKKDLTHAWVYEADFESKFGEAKLKAGVGYTIAADKQDNAQEYSIIRMPMKSNVAANATEAAKSVAVTAYGILSEVSDNHKGWNLVGNPYMVSISGAEADSKLVVGYLQETGTGPWEWVDDEIRYVTIPSDDGSYYWQEKFNKATLKPFKNFFLQIGTSGDLSFALANRQNAPARYMQAKEREVEFEILLDNDARQDHTGFLIADKYTPEYEINADLEKMENVMSVYSILNGYQLAYNALSPEDAKEDIPVGFIANETGSYTFSLAESGDVEAIEHIWLTDHEIGDGFTTDLIDDTYSFSVGKTGKNNTRFTVRIELKDKQEVPTDIGTIQSDDGQSTRVMKFLYRDKMYILRNGVLYDATGKKVSEINK